MMIDSGVTVPVEIIHWGVDTDKFFELERRSDGVFTFGTMGALSIRKGTHILVEAFERAFPTEQDVRLICKTSNRHYPFMNKDKRIEVQMGPVTHEELVDQFFKRVDCFVFPTLGEGFGLTPLEAMATGIPAIVTGWSGPEDYMNDEVGWRIEHTMDEAKEFSDPRTGVYKEPCGDWAIPQIDHLVSLMRYAYEHQDEVKAKGKRAAQYVREEWTWDAQIGLFEDALNKHL
jgi:glycosyltransferase involved in cell wall biosynthesis